MIASFFGVNLAFLQTGGSRPAGGSCLRAQPLRFALHGAIQIRRDPIVKRPRLKLALAVAKAR